MKAIAGVFKSKDNAGRAVAELRTLGITNDRISLLTPGSTQQELNAVPTLTAEKPGMAKALGAVVGGTVGLAGGWEIATVLAGALIPGVGPVVVAGILGGAIVGALGAVGVGAAAGAMDANLSAGLPEDELLCLRRCLAPGAQRGDRATRSRAGGCGSRSARTQWRREHRQGPRDDVGRRARR